MKSFIPNYALFNLLSILSLGLVFTSCKSTRYTPNSDQDTVYNSSSASQNIESNQKSSYYRDYFQKKAQLYSTVPNDDIIFTDVEAYTSLNEYIDEEGFIHENRTYSNEGYGSWGDHSEVTINIYNRPSWGFYDPFWMSGFGWYGPGWTWRSRWHWGWGGYYGPYWGWGWNSPYYWHGGWGGWGYPYHGIYYHPYYGNYSNIAYNRGRSNTDYYRPSRTVGRNSSANRSTNSYSRSETTRRINNRSSDSNTRNQNNTNRVSTDQNNTIRNNNSNRNNTNTTRSNSGVRNSGNSTRNSGTMRSSGGNSRSSGGNTSRGSGGRSGGRG